ncbi:MAG: right-handed parallel beta-helix repeat-containing protein [Thermoanaerobaculales bacterium]
MNRTWLFVALLVVRLAFALPAGAAEYYVSPNGDDASRYGSQSRPWRTIQKAAEAMSAGDTCHVKDGEYSEMVRPANSGAAGQYISFVAEGQAVELNGARRITGWTVHSGNIWKASVASDFGELYVDRQRMVLARWPNLTTGDIYRPNFYQATANGGDTSIIDSVHLTQPSGYWSGAKIFMVAGLGWSADQRDVIGYDPAGHRITFSPAISSSEWIDADEYSLYFLYDLLSLLDAPSEWFLDRAAHTVYLWLPDGGDPNDHLVEAPGGSGGFDLTDRSYIRVAGFKLMSSDIKMQNATGCLVEGVRHLYPATELSVSGSDNVITGSEIAYASYTGVRLSGTRNTLSKCHVHHCDYFGTWNAIVEFGNHESMNGGSQNTIAGCLLHDTGRDGVYIVQRIDISGCIIEHSEIYNTGLIGKDCGGLYTSLTDGRGTVIRYNIVHDIWPKESLEYGPLALGEGIYLDEGSSGFVVHHNVAYRTAAYAICLNQPSRNNLVYNNTAVGSGGVGGGWGDVLAAPSMGQGFVGVDGTVVANNLAVMLDGRSGWCMKFDGKTPDYHHNGYYNPSNNDRRNNQGVEATGVTGNPRFVDATGNDFSLLAGSPMIDKGVVVPGITDGYVGSGPDIGAYERGGSEVPGPQYELLPDGITLLSPNGGESWMVGSSHTITWTSLGTIANVKIEYSTNSGASYTTVIGSTANDGSYTWTVPNTPSASCLVRVSDASNAAVNDVSDAIFNLEIMQRARRRISRVPQ